MTADGQADRTDWSWVWRGLAFSFIAVFLEGTAWIFFASRENERSDWGGVASMATWIGGLVTVMAAAYALTQWRIQSTRRTITLGSDVVHNLLLPEWAEEFRLDPKESPRNLFWVLENETSTDPLSKKSSPLPFYYARIANSMERLGVLLNLESIDEGLVAELIGERVLRTWMKLKGSIYARRSDRGRYGQAFEDLVKRIVLYKLRRQPRAQWGKMGDVDLVQAILSDMKPVPTAEGEKTIRKVRLFTRNEIDAACASRERRRKWLMDHRLESASFDAATWTLAVEVDS